MSAWDCGSCGEAARTDASRPNLMASSISRLRKDSPQAQGGSGPLMIHIETDLYGPNPPGSSWWDVPVSEVSRLESTQQARLWYEGKKADQRHYLR